MATDNTNYGENAGANQIVGSAIWNTNIGTNTGYDNTIKAILPRPHHSPTTELSRFYHVYTQYNLLICTILIKCFYISSNYRI